MSIIIVASPHGGFGNRIRVLCSICYYADIHGCEVQHLWDGQSYLCAYPHIQRVHNRGFAYFFEDRIPTHIKSPTSPTICYSEWLPSSTGWWKHQNYGQTQLGCSRIESYKHIPNTPTQTMLIETSLRILPMTASESHAIYKKYFIPRAIFTNQLPSLPENTIGISIRRGEFLAFFPGSAVDTTILYRWLRSFTQPVVLFSEDRAFLKDIRAALLHPIICEFESTVSVLEDRAFLEFLTLSKCSHIYGTQYSSFAEEAALYGKVSYTAITNELLK